MCEYCTASEIININATQLQSTLGLTSTLLLNCTNSVLKANSTVNGVNHHNNYNNHVTDTINLSTESINDNYNFQFQQTTKHNIDEIKKRNKLIEFLKEPSISELNVRLNKLVETTKYATQLNENLKDDLIQHINSNYRCLNERKSQLGQNLIDKKHNLNSNIVNLTSANLKIRNNLIKKANYQSLIQCEIELNQKQLNEIDKLNKLLNEKHGFLKQLSQDYTVKSCEIDCLKNNFSNLNDNYLNLNENLSNTKHENNNLKDIITSLKREIEFYKNFKQWNSNDTTNIPVNTKSRVFDLELYMKYKTIKDTNFYKDELNTLRDEIRNDYEVYTRSQLDEYENECEEQFLNELNQQELEMNSEYDKYDAEYDEALAELNDLNEQFLVNLTQYRELNEHNSQLNERLINLNESLLKFSKKNIANADVIMLKYSLSCLKRHISENKSEIEKFELKLSNLKNMLFNKNLNCILSENLLLKSIKSIISVEKLKQMLSSGPNVLQTQQCFDVKYTKTNIFGYLQFNLNLNHKTSLLRVVHNTSQYTDTNVLIIENLDKVLDIDLSEWVLRREIYNSIKLSNGKNLKKTDSIVVCDHDGDDKVIEFKFPKGFKLKRRKKLALLSASAANQIEYQALTISAATLTKPSNQISTKQVSKRSLIVNSPSSTTNTSTLTTKSKGSSNLKLNINSNNKSINKTVSKSAPILNSNASSKDTDYYNCTQINDWGCGLQIVTKLINNKNMTKFVNYKSFKSIWVNLD